jgi:hypothetical protein
MTTIVLERWEAALLASALGGAIVTSVWAEVSYWLLRRSSPELTGTDRSRLVSALSGILERLFLTTLTIWLEGAVGAITAALLAVKAIMAWGELKDLHPGPSRKRFTVAFLNGFVSVIWAIVWGIWAKH